MSNNADLPDLNVWLALATPDHFHHQQALDYWEQQAAERVHFCTVTALGLVNFDRGVINPTYRSAQPLT